jgi:hypothetical protein
MKPELIFQIPPLQPVGRSELQAHARQGDMQAIIILRPYYTPGVYQWETYWDRINTKIRRKLTPGQDERGLGLARLLKERLTQALEAAGWQAAGQNAEGRPLWRSVELATREPSSALAPVQKPERPALITRSRRPSKKTSVPPPAVEPSPTAPITLPQPAQEPLARKRIEVPMATRPRAAYQRTIQARLVTFTCQQCGSTVTEQHFPGPQPRYCTEACKQEAMRAGTLARVHRFRARHQAENKGSSERTSASAKDM